MTLMITHCQTSDIKMLELLIPENILVDKVIADGGYYSIGGVERLNNCGITPIILPPSNAIIHGKEIPSGMIK